MRKLTVLVSLVGFLLAVAVPGVMARCSVGHAAGEKTAEAVASEVVGEEALESGVVINKICPVMGGEVGEDTVYKVEYDGKVIGFCCEACVEKFNENPEEYLQKLEEAEAEQ